eukprot:12145293-Heterocapsa_arctica.AAC.1
MYAPAFRGSGLVTPTAVLSGPARQLQVVWGCFPRGCCSASGFAPFGAAQLRPSCPFGFQFFR